MRSGGSAGLRKYACQYIRYGSWADTQSSLLKYLSLIKSQKFFFSCEENEMATTQATTPILTATMMTTTTTIPQSQPSLATILSLVSTVIDQKL